MVHLSSGGVLNKSDDAVAKGARLIDETDYPAEAPRFCSYKASKWHSEQRALEWVRQGLPVAIASTTCPIGRGDETPTPTGQIIRDFLQRRFPFYCRTGLNFVNVGDLSRGLQIVAASGQVGERYLLSGENLWLKEFLDLLAEETGLPAPRMSLPNAVIRLIGCAGEAIDFLNPHSTSARVCLETSVQAKRVQFFSNDKARNELGWNPVGSIRAGVAEAVAWFRQETDLELAGAATPSVGIRMSNNLTHFGEYGRGRACCGGSSLGPWQRETKRYARVRPGPFRAKRFPSSSHFRPLRATGLKFVAAGLKSLRGPARCRQRNAAWNSRGGSRYRSAFPEAVAGGAS